MTKKEIEKVVEKTLFLVDEELLWVDHSSYVHDLWDKVIETLRFGLRPVLRESLQSALSQVDLIKQADRDSELKSLRAENKELKDKLAVYTEIEKRVKDAQG